MHRSHKLLGTADNQSVNRVSTADFVNASSRTAPGSWRKETVVVKRLVATASSSRLLTIGYIFMGAVVSGTHHYFDNLTTVRQVIAALLAVLVWPLLWYPQIHIS
jgi:hypothetical protein